VACHFRPFCAATENIIPQVKQPPCDFLLFPKLLYILKGKTFDMETTELNAVVKLLEKF
jgi:hypothetical protein